MNARKTCPRTTVHRQTNYCAVTPRGKGNTNQVEPEHTRRLPASSSLQHVRDDACHGA